MFGLLNESDCEYFVYLINKNANVNVVLNENNSNLLLTLLQLPEI